MSAYGILAVGVRKALDIIIAAIVAHLGIGLKLLKPQFNDIHQVATTFTAHNHPHAPCQI